MSEIKEYHSSFTGPEVDALLTKVKDGSITADIEKELAEKANVNGRYPEMSVGFADDLVGRGESVPAEFSFRASGGKSIKDGAARIKRLKGNSVVWNQRLHNATLDEQGVWFNQRASAIYSNGEVTISANDEFSNLCQTGVFHTGHKYLVDTEIKSSNTSSIHINFASGYDSDIASNITENYQRFTHILTLGQTNTDVFQLYAIDSTAVWSVRKCLLYDLTQMFGAGNEPTTIEEYEARKPIVEDEYAFNEGEVIHMTAEGVKSVGDNAWDEEWEVGGLSADGEPVSAANRIRSRNYIKVLANEEYYSNRYLTIFFYDDEMRFLSYMDMNTSTFTTPSGCRYIKFYLYGAEDYSNDIMITLVHSGWKQDTDAGYQPYWEDRLMFDQRIKDEFPDGMKEWDMVYNKNGKGYIVKGTGVRAYEDGDTEDATVITDGSSTIYELSTPEVIEYDEPFNLDYRVADFGTEQAITEQPSAPISADIIYQFNAVDMIREHELEIAELQSIIATMQAQLASLASKE